MGRHAKVNWHQVRSELLKGMTVGELSALYGIAEQTIWNRAHTEKWELGKAKAAILREVAEGKEGREIEVEVERLGGRMMASSLRSKVMMAEEVEWILRRLREAGGMNELTKSRCLAALAQVCEKVHRWSSEPSSEELSRLKTAAVNLTLIRTPPERLRQMAKAKSSVAQAEAGGIGGESREASG
jgi:hypothetical protein